MALIANRMPHMWIAGTIPNQKQTPKHLMNVHVTFIYISQNTRKFILVISQTAFYRTLNNIISKAITPLTQRYKQHKQNQFQLAPF